ncbi:MAG TPA: hypothetical protein VFU82_00710 [Gammaproteobacteria bacterium]|nr:hypothetical protein [Gammaproteobacteria bacterium]
MMRNTEKTALLKTQRSSINDGEMPRPSCLTSTGRVLHNIHEAINRPIDRIEPKIEKLNEAMSYGDPLIYTLMGLALYDFILNNAAGFPNQYRRIANWSDMLVLPFLLFTLATSLFHLTRDNNKRSSSNKAAFMTFTFLMAALNGIASASFTEDTVFAFSLDNTDPNGSTPSDSNINVLYNILSASTAIGLVVSAMSFAEEYIRHHERDGRVFAKTLRNSIADTPKAVIGAAYTFIRTFLFGSQFNGGTINQATIDIMQDWLKINLTDITANTRTAIFIGGHTAGFALEAMLLAIKSKPMKELVERGFSVLAGVFFLEEYFTDLATSINLDHESDLITSGKSLAAILTWVAIVGGTVKFGLDQHRKKAANQEMFFAPIKDEEKDTSSSPVNAAEKPAAKNASVSNLGIYSSKQTSSEDVLPIDDDEYLTWLQQYSNLSAS